VREADQKRKSSSKTKLPCFDVWPLVIITRFTAKYATLKLSISPWTCFTEDKQAAADIASQLPHVGPLSNTGELKTMRLAHSCNGEYSNFFGAFDPSQSALVYAAFNATLTRCNGCYERDLAIHLNLISNAFEDLIIFYDPATDPYTTLPNWNAQLPNLLNNVVGNANYDIGHIFGASGGGGNAGCIGRC
jgi:reprolysin-like metallo-peptidase family M12B